MGCFVTSPKTGLTLLELLVAMALAGMILAISFPSLTSGLDGLRLEASGRRVAAFVNGARNRAERDQIPVEISLEAKSNRISALSAGGQWERTLELAEGVRLRNDEQDRPRRWMVYPGVPAPRLRIELVTNGGRVGVVVLDPLSGAAQVDEETR